MSRTSILPPITQLFPGIADTMTLPLIREPAFCIDLKKFQDPQIKMLPLKKRPTPPPMQFIMHESVQPIQKQEKPKVPAKTTTKSQSSVKNKFTIEEDKLLTELASKSKVHNWNEIAEKIGTRNARQCRERWNNYLDPSLRQDPWTEEEDRLLLAKHREFGTHWNKISKCFKNRSDNSIRNRWQLLMRHMEKQQGNLSSPMQLSE